MQLTIDVPADEDANDSLRRWLGDEPLLTGFQVTPVDRGRPAGDGPPAGRQPMSAVADALRLVGDADLLTAVATTVGVWLGTRVRRTRITIHRGPNRVEIDTNRFRDASAITEYILRELHHDHDTRRSADDPGRP